MAVTSGSGGEHGYICEPGFTKRYFVSDLEYSWHPAAHSTNIEILKDQPHVIRRKIAKQSTDGARGQAGFSNGYHVFRFDFNDKPWGSHCALGVCTDDTALQSEGRFT